MSSHSVRSAAASLEVFSRAQGQTQGGGHADGGCAPDDHVLDRRPDLGVVPATDEYFFIWKASLIDHHDRAILPRHRRDHRSPPERSS